LVWFVHWNRKLEPRTKPLRFSIGSVRFLIRTINIGFFFCLDWFGSSVQLDFSDPLTPLITTIHSQRHFKNYYFNLFETIYYKYKFNILNLKISVRGTIKKSDFIRYRISKEREGWIFFFIKFDVVFIWFCRNFVHYSNSGWLFLHIWCSARIFSHSKE
jgi:hypothetical protein